MATPSNNARAGSGFDTLSVVLLTLAVVLFVFALSLFLQGGFLSAQKVDHRAKLALDGDPDLAAHEAEQRDLLHGQPTWIDPEAGTLSLPIDAAMDKLVAEQKEAGND